MRAGNLDRVIQIQNATTEVNVFGTKTQTWGAALTMRAQQLVNATTNSEGAREVSDDKITFRMRWVDGVTLESSVTYEGQRFKIQSIKEIGRRIGLDLICERAGQ